VKIFLKQNLNRILLIFVASSKDDRRHKMIFLSFE